MKHVQMCDTDLRRFYCGAGFLEHRLVTLTGVTYGPQRGWVTAMTHAQMCDTDLRRCCGGAGFLEHCLVWSPCQSHRCDIAMVLRGGGSQP